MQTRQDTDRLKHNWSQWSRYEIEIIWDQMKLPAAAAAAKWDTTTDTSDTVRNFFSVTGPDHE